MSGSTAGGELDGFRTRWPAGSEVVPARREGQPLYPCGVGRSVQREVGRPGAAHVYRL